MTKERAGELLRLRGQLARMPQENEETVKISDACDFNVDGSHTFCFGQFFSTSLSWLRDWSL